VAETDQPEESRPSERSEDGVDLTLIRWVLPLTPAERLEMHDRLANEIEEIRERNRGAAKRRNSEDSGRSCGGFVVVGGIAAVLRGAPINTWDLDVVHSTAADNVPRVLAALDELDAHYRLQPERHLRPMASHMESPGPQLLMTSLGALDVLGGIGPGWTYDDLVPHSDQIDVGDGLEVRVLALAMVIRSKEAAGGEKDLAVHPVLRQTLREQGAS
jgi:hypothetical protein